MGRQQSDHREAGSQLIATAVEEVVMIVGVEHALEMTDVFKVSAEIRRAVLENDGPDYLRVFECENGRIVGRSIS